MKALTLRSIHIYPIKSLGGISLQEAVVEKRGLQYDRRFMLVDSEGKFITQREHTILAKLKCEIRAASSLWKTLNVDANSGVNIPLVPDEKGGTFKKVQVWSAKLKALLVDPKLDAWFEDVVGLKCHLVYMPDSIRRGLNPFYAGLGQEVSFADGYPYLITGMASLEDLNGRLEAQIPMNRFRPNFVFEGGVPYEEVDWKNFTIGQVAFKNVKNCGRCLMVNIDQDRGEQAGKEPLKTLSSYRKKGNKVIFGQNLIWKEGDKGNLVKIGDAIHLD